MSSVKLICISDLHLNHPKISTRVLVDRLIKTLLTVPKLKTYKYLVITGDVFDRPTQMDTDAGKAIIMFISFIISFAKRNDLTILLLKGTGSHDGDQPAHFVEVNSGLLEPAKLVYFDEVSIWSDKETGLTFLGVPDEATPSCAQTQALVESTLKSNGLTKVDIALTHGMYTSHVINGIVDEHSHSSEYYNSIVKQIIINGHIHTTSQYKKILTVGSFDRNRHGEEELKGGWLLDIHPNDNRVELTFLENSWATTFNTYTVKGETISEGYEEVIDYIEDNYNTIVNGYLRLAYKPDIDINSIIRKLQDKYSPNIEFSTKKLDSKESPSQVGDKLIEFDTIETTPITKATVEALMLDKLTRLNVTNIDECMAQFKTLL